MSEIRFARFLESATYLVELRTERGASDGREMMDWGRQGAGEQEVPVSEKPDHEEVQDRGGEEFDLGSRNLVEVRSPCWHSGG